MKILQHIRAFVSGMMGVRDLTLSETVEELRKLPFDWEMHDRIIALENKKKPAKRKRTRKAKV